jgi:hypothetical protein
LDIRDFLEKEGPCLSSKIKQALKNGGRSEEAARQKISRAKGDVYHLQGIRFPKRESFLYLKQDFNSPIYFLKLVKALEETASIHICIISGLRTFGGNVSKEKLRILSACPHARKKKKTFDQAVKELVSIRLIYEENDRYYLNDAIFENPDESRTMGSLNIFIQNILAQWLKNNGLVSYNTPEFNSDFCSYFWDIKAVSYLLPFSKSKAGSRNPGFVVADVIPKENIGDDSINYFIRKTESCYLEKNSPPFLPILIGFNFQRETLLKLRAKNILVSTVSNFFGKETSRLLEKIKVLLQKKSLNNTSDIDILHIEEALQDISRLDIDVNNLKGHLFELIVAHILANTNPGNVPIINKIIHFEGRQKEIDVFVSNSKEIDIYECKAYKQLVDDTEISKWKGKISSIYRYFKSMDDNSNKDIKFHFWITSDFTQDAKSILNKASGDTRKYSIEKKNGKEIFQYTKEWNLTSLSKILQEYFSCYNEEIQ